MTTATPPPPTTDEQPRGSVQRLLEYRNRAYVPLVAVAVGVFVAVSVANLASRSPTAQDGSLCTGAISRVQSLVELVGGLALALIVVVWFTRRLVGPIDELRRTALQVGNGKLKARLAPAGSFETRELGAAFNGMAAHLETVVHQVRDTSRTLQEAARSLVAATSEQSSAASQTSASMEELARTSASIADTLTAVASRAQETREGLEMAQGDVRRSSVSNAALTADITKVTEALAAIDEMASATNNLALNASVEAARAGDNGRTFSVIAEEVQRLAEASKRSVAEIEAVIESVRRQAAETVTAMERGGAGMRRGLELIAGLSDAAVQVQMTTHEQRLASESVVVAMEQIRQGSRDIAVTAQQLQGTAAAQAKQAAEAMFIANAHDEQDGDLQLIQRNGESRGRMGQLVHATLFPFVAFIAAVCLVVGLSTLLAPTAVAASGSICPGAISSSVIYGTGALAFPAALIVTALFVRWLLRPVNSLRYAAKAISRGELAARARPSGPIEMRSACVAFNLMAENLAGLVGQMRETGGQADTAAQRLAAASTQQSAGVTETSASATELSRTSAAIALAMARVAQQARDAQRMLVGARAHFDRSSAQSRTLAEDVRTVTASLGIINEMAAQTNMLALNAMIEAARAGDYGAGFASVALEVRNLADRSHDTADSIAEVIAAALAQTAATVATLERRAVQLARGVELMEEVVAASSQVQMTTEEQRVATEYVASAMEQLTFVSRQISTTAQTLSAPRRPLAIRI